MVHLSAPPSALPPTPSPGGRQVTCILKADLGGWLSEGGVFHSLAAGLGLIDALMDRLLTAVILLRDDVEQQRFKVGRER